MEWAAGLDELRHSSGCSGIAPDGLLMRGAARIPHLRTDAPTQLSWAATLLPLRTFPLAREEETMSTRARHAALDGAALGLAVIAVGMLALWWWMWWMLPL